MGSLAKKVAATVLAAHFDEELCSLVRCAKSIFSFWSQTIGMTWRLVCRWSEQEQMKAGPWWKLSFRCRTRGRLPLTSRY